MSNKCRLISVEALYIPAFQARPGKLLTFHRLLTMHWRLINVDYCRSAIQSTYIEITAPKHATSSGRVDVLTDKMMTQRQHRRQLHLPDYCWFQNNSFAEENWRNRTADLNSQKKRRLFYGE